KNSFNSFVRKTKSSSSKTPSANLRKNRGIPFSNIFPRTLKTFASGSTFSASGNRYCSVPPVPLSNNNVGFERSLPFLKICFMTRFLLILVFQSEILHRLSHSLCPLIYSLLEVYLD